RFVIRDQEGSDDVAAMHEVINRRFRRLLDEQARSEEWMGEDGPMLVDPDTGRPRKFAYAPGLVVVDGGAPQVAAAQRALDELGIDDIPVCGLAKRLEEVWLPAKSGRAEDPVILPRSSEGLYLLQRVRDEAHRFYVVANLPPNLLPAVVRLVDESQGRSQPIAVVVDVRSGSFFQGLRSALAHGVTGRDTTLVFLDATDEVLVRRQEAARRPHPLQEGGRLLDGLEQERVVLADLRGDADLVID